MSDDLHQGYVFRTSDFQKLDDGLNRFAKKVQGLYENLASEVVSAIAHASIDLGYHKRTVLDRPLDRARKDFRESTDTAKPGVEETVNDMTCRIALTPYRGRVYGLIFTWQPAFERALIDSGLVEEFGNWGGFDAPPGIDAAQWKRQGAVWSRIYKRKPRGFDLAGFNFDASPRAIDVSVDQALASAPSREARARRLAETLAEMRYVRPVGQGSVEAAEAIRAEAEKQVEWLKDRLPEIGRDELVGGIDARGSGPHSHHDKAFLGASDLMPS